MRLACGRRLLRLRDRKEFEIVETRDCTDPQNGVTRVYRLVSVRGQTEAEYSNDLELLSGRTRFSIVPDGNETFRLPH